MENVEHSLNSAVGKVRRRTLGIDPAATQPSMRPVALKWNGYRLESRSAYERALGNLVAELGDARENEREKIANDLHDRIGQNLVLAMMKLRLLESSVSKQQKPLAREVQRLLSGVIHETRSLMCDLYPHALRDLGIQAALRWLIQRTRANYGLECVAEMTSVPDSLSRDVAETIFQAVRELLINVAKHARAKHVTVIVRGEERRMLIKVVDDGKGFEPSRLSPVNPLCGGFGLLSIRERLLRLGGSIDIESAPGEGTKITMSLPRNSEARA